MSWFYEIRGQENRLVEVRGGFATEKAAREAGECAKRMIDCICYPNPEVLSLLITAGTLPTYTDERDVQLKYPWQQLVLDAFMEPSSTKILYKIGAAERALAARIGGVTVPGSEEHVAIGEALLALRRLISQLQSKATSRAPKENEEEIA